MKYKDIVKTQFDKQAERFSKWSQSQDEKHSYMQKYFNCCDISQADTMLDVACGTGEFAIFSADKVKWVNGVDFSPGVIDVAKNNSRKKGITNITFNCGDVEELPYRSGSFSIVICKFSFHHMKNYHGVFNEMIRCCQKGGRISTQDFVSYDSPEVNEFFEKLEGEIDVSHQATLSSNECLRLFDESSISIVRRLLINWDIGFEDCKNHAIREKENEENIYKLLEAGLKDPLLSGFLFFKNNELHIRKRVLTILGTK